MSFEKCQCQRNNVVLTHRFPIVRHARTQSKCPCNSFPPFFILSFSEWLLSGHMQSNERKPQRGHKTGKQQRQENNNSSSSSNYTKDDLLNKEHLNVKHTVEMDGWWRQRRWIERVNLMTKKRQKNIGSQLQIIHLVQTRSMRNSPNQYMHVCFQSME